MIICYANLRKRRILILTAFLGILLLCTLVSLRLSPDSTVMPFFPNSDSRSVQLVKLLSQSPLSRLVFIDIASRDETLLHQAIDTVAHAIPHDIARPVSFSPREISPESVLSLLPSFFDADMLHHFSLFNEMAMTALLQDDISFLASPAGSFSIPWVQKDPLQLRRLLQRLSEENHLSNFVSSSPYHTSADGQHVLLLYSIDSTLATDSAINLFNKLLDLKKFLPQGVSIQFSGGPLHTAINAQTIEKDIRRIALFSLAGIAVIYFFMVRSLAVIWLVFVPAAATLIACSISSLLWPTVSTLALGFAASLMGLAEDYAALMYFGLRSGHDTANIHSTLAKPIIISCLLNLSGFTLLLFSSIPAICQLALFSIISLGSGCLIALIILPLLPWNDHLQSRDKQDLSHPPHLSSHTRTIACAFILSCSIALLFPLTKFDFSPRSLGMYAYEFTEAAQQIRSRWALATKIPLVIKGKDFEDSLENSREVVHSLRTKASLKPISPTDFLPSLSERKANCLRWKTWQEQESTTFLAQLDKAAANTGFIPAAFTSFKEILLSPAQVLTLESIPPSLSDISTFYFFRIGAEHFTIIFLEELPANLSLEKILGPRLSAHSFLVDPSHLEQELTNLFRAEKPLIFLSILFCFIVLWVSQKNTIHTLVMLIPPLSSILSILIVFLLLGETFTLTACIAISIVLGLSLDHGIMVTHTLETGKELGIRKAVSLSTLTALLSMGLLAFAEHPALHSMGLVICIGLTAEFFSALFLLPLLYSKEK